MYLLDTKTVILSYIISNTICTMVVTSLWIENRKRFRGLGLWLADFVLQFVATILVALRGLIPDLISATVSNAFIIGGTILLYIGLERFVGKRGPQFQNAILWVVFVTVHAYYVIVEPNLGVRNIIFSFALLILCLQCAWLLLHRVDVEMRPMSRNVAIIFAAYSFLSLIRIFIDLLVDPGTDFLRSNVYDTTVVLLYQMFFIALTFMLFLLVNRYLVLDLERDIQARELAEEAMRLGEEKFQKAFQSSPDAMLISRLNDGWLLDVNDGFTRLTEYPREEALSHTSLDLHIWVNLQDRNTFIETLVRDRRVHEAEYKFRSKSGRIFRGLVSAETITIGNDEVTLAVVRDITRQKKLEESLRYRNDLLETLHQVTLDLLNRRDIDDILRTFLLKIGHLLNASDVSFDLVDDDMLVTQAASPGQPLKVGDRLRHGEGGFLSWQAVETGRPAVLEDYATWPKRRDLYEGFPIHAILIVPIKRNGRVVGTVNFSRREENDPFTGTDIYVAEQMAQSVALILDNAQVYLQLKNELMERRQIEDVLRISRENFMGYFNMGTVGMCVTSAEKKWIEVNDHFCRMLGYSREELELHTWDELTYPDDLEADLALFDQVLRGERDSYQMDKRFVRRDGGVVYTTLFASCQRYPDRSVRYVLISLVDITERIQKENALQDAQAEVLSQQRKMAVFDERQQLARNLHDSVNQSIHSLVLFAETLDSALVKNNLKRATEISSRLQESARQALKEVRLLLYQLQPTGARGNVDLLRDLEERLATVERRAGIKAFVILEGSIDNCPEAWWENLFWICIEALNNSLKHAKAHNVSVHLYCAPKKMEMEIKDDGVGFDPGQVRAGGMGLRSMQERAELLGGRLSFKSTLGKGSSVIFYAEIKGQP